MRLPGVMFPPPTLPQLRNVGHMSLTFYPLRIHAAGCESAEQVVPRSMHLRKWRSSGHRWAWHIHIVPRTGKELVPTRNSQNQGYQTVRGRTNLDFCFSLLSNDSPDRLCRCNGIAVKKNKEYIVGTNKQETRRIVPIGSEK